MRYTIKSSGDAENILKLRSGGDSNDHIELNASGEIRLAGKVKAFASMASRNHNVDYTAESDGFLMVFYI